MNKTSISLLRTIRETDESLSFEDKAVLEDLIDGRVSRKKSGGGPLLLTQKEAAKLLGVNRVTIWRMTNEDILRPVEILPGTFRYRAEDIEAISQSGIAA